MRNEYCFGISIYGCVAQASYSSMKLKFLWYSCKEILVDGRYQLGQEIIASTWIEPCSIKNSRLHFLREPRELKLISSECEIMGNWHENDSFKI